MNYTDEESRLTFHQSKTLLQMACNMFESFCFLHGQIPEFIDLLDEDTAVLGVPEIKPEQGEDICQKMNAQFPRLDKFSTCQLTDQDLGVFQVFVTSTEDFGNVN